MSARATPESVTERLSFAGALKARPLVGRVSRAGRSLRCLYPDTRPGGFALRRNDGGCRRNWQAM